MLQNIFVVSSDLVIATVFIVSVIKSQNFTIDNDINMQEEHVMRVSYHNTYQLCKEYIIISNKLSFIIYFNP